MTDFYRITALIASGTLGILKAGEMIGAFYADRFSRTWPRHIRKSSARNEIAIYKRTGSGESQGCILLVHGMGNSSVSLVRLGDEIVELTGKPVIRYDRPGYGASRFCTDTPYSVTQSVDELVEIVRWLHKQYRQVTVIGHSFGGLLAYLALMGLEEPDWCDALLIEPSHLHEVAIDSKRMLGVILGVEELRNRHLLSAFGGELLDASIGPHSLDGRRYPHIDAVRRERRSGRCVRATRREFTTLAKLLFDGKIIRAPRPSANVRVVASARSVEDARQKELFSEYIYTPEDLTVLDETSHDTIILDKGAVKRIAQMVNGGDIHVA